MTVNAPDRLSGRIYLMLVIVGMILAIVAWYRAIG
jgi:hypothetical protein